MTLTEARARAVALERIAADVDGWPGFEGVAEELRITAGRIRALCNRIEFLEEEAKEHGRT